MGSALRTRRFGSRIYWYFQVDSTMRIARFFAREGAEEGTVVMAEEQTQGRGKGGCRWFSPRGGIWFSLILRPHLIPSMVFRLSLLGAVGIVEAVEEVALCLSPKIRWPNDALVNGRKIGGVLCETRLDQNKVNFVVMGIGVNLNIEDFPSSLYLTATSLKRETGEPISQGIFLAVLLRKLEELYFQEDFSRVLEKARFFSSLLGRQVKIKVRGEEFIGWAQDLDERGNLMLRLESGVMRRISPKEGHVVLYALEPRTPYPAQRGAS